MANKNTPKIIGSAPGSGRPKGRETLDQFISTIGASALAHPNRYVVFFKGTGPVKAAQKIQSQVSPTLKATFNNFNTATETTSVRSGEAAGAMGVGGGSNFMRNISMYCESIQMPGQNIRSVEDPLRFGPQREQAQGVTYGSVNARFICSRDLREKRFFEEWQDLIFNNETWEMKFYKDYIGGIKIYQEDKRNRTTYCAELFEVFPKVLQQQELGWNMNDTYQTISVELMFHSWKRSEHYLSTVF